MGSKWLRVVMVMISVLVLEVGLSNGCWEKERDALLQLKSFFVRLREEESSDCCQWERVECNITTRRVMKLSLNDTLPSIPTEKWYLNVSLFLPFEELRRLYLNENQIAGCVENEGFGKLSKLSHLEIIDLSGNYFNASTLSSLSKISSLKSLSLSRNDLFTRSNHTNDLKWLSRLSSLKTLDLSATNLKNNSLLHLGSLLSLTTLIVSENNLEGMVDLQEFYKLKFLKTLDLSGNQIESFQSFHGKERQLSLINLEVLDLSYNLFNNSILEDLGGFSNLKFLHLSGNQLNGSIDIKEFCAWSNLETLDMSGNKVNQFVNSEENRCLRKLKTLYLDGVSTEQNLSLLSLLEPFSFVKTLVLRGNSYLNKTVLSQELHVLSNVENLFLDHTPLDIKFLQSIGSLTSLKTLSLVNCSLTGTLPAQGNTITF